MRDLILACIVFGSLPFILKRPFVGILMLAWLGYMNPHRLAWGFMFSMPIVLIVAAVTLLGMLISREAKRMVWSREVVVLICFILWMGLTTSQAFYPSFAIVQYEKVIKIQILTFMTLLLLTTKEKIHWFIVVVAGSLAFYGVKGGIFVLGTGGNYRVWGPAGTFIGGNNEMALALVMTIPLIMYLYLTTKSLRAKAALGAAMTLCAISAVGSQSRGALVALMVTGVIFWAKSRHKLFVSVFVTVAAVFVVSFMPDEWFERMNTIKTYDEDLSAIGRINAWWTAFNLANDRFLGGGFDLWQWDVFQMYAPDPNNVRDVHSIYFEVLGEHGYVGLALFLTLLALTWFKCGSIIRMGKSNPSMFWARDLAAMIQVSLIAYMTAGAFLGLAYFDYPYHLIAVTVVLHSLVAIDKKAAKQPAKSPVTPQTSAA
jgi:putative inorganic carbon (hco3(-)) transporter